MGTVEFSALERKKIQLLQFQWSLLQLERHGFAVLEDTAFTEDLDRYLHRLLELGDRGRVVRILETILKAEPQRRGLAFDHAMGLVDKWSEMLATESVNGGSDERFDGGGR